MLANKDSLIMAGMGLIPVYNTKFVSKGWGWEEWIRNTPLYCLKKMFCKQGKMCSWHYHIKKDETFLLISGELMVEWSTDDEVPKYPCSASIERYNGWSTLKPGSSFYVPPLLRHRFYGIEDSLFIEASTQHFDEDSIRLIKGD